MSRSERGLSRWTEAIGVVAVIVSLIFVGVEIRQNTRAVRGATYQDLASSSMELLFYVADNPEIGRQLAEWGASEEQDPEVVQRVEAVLLAYLRHLENAHYQMMEGTLDPEYLSNWVDNPTLSSPHFADFWVERRSGFSSRFREFFEDRRGLLLASGSVYRLSAESL